MTNSSDINQVFRPLNILRGDIGERGPASGDFDRLPDRLLSKGTEHGRESEKERGKGYSNK